MLSERDRLVIQVTITGHNPKLKNPEGKNTCTHTHRDYIAQLLHVRKIPPSYNETCKIFMAYNKKCIIH